MHETMNETLILTNNREKLLLFDVDGTIAESGKQISIEMETLLLDISRKYRIGIVGGGKLEKILWQTRETLVFDHYFTECGCVYDTPISSPSTNLYAKDFIPASALWSPRGIHSFLSKLREKKSKSPRELQHIYTKNLREHALYPKINILVKTALEFLSRVDYMITGNFIDLRNGIIYISLVGMSATEEERHAYIKLDEEHNYRSRLIDVLMSKARSLEIDSGIQICEGGHVGIAIYPIEYDKEQVMEVLLDKDDVEIHYFGDKYQPNGNDHRLINNPNVIGHPVDSIDDTIEILKKMALRIL